MESLHMEQQKKKTYDFGWDKRLNSQYKLKKQYEVKQLIELLPCQGMIISSNI
jgi:hypothetical protein